MLEVTDAQLSGWLAAFMFPLARILGLIASAPIFNSRIVSARIRLVVGLAIAMAVLPALPPMPDIPTDSLMALGVLAHQALIGIAIGFMMRLFFAAIDIAGELIGLQMGLSFAVFFSPQTGGQTSVVAEFLGLLAMLVFLGLDGHLMLVKILVHSFEWLPVGTATGSSGWMLIVRYASVMFTTGVLMALPIAAALLITNIALGILTRTAPQLNLFAVGFPVSLGVGFLLLSITVGLLAPVFQRLFGYGFDAIDELIQVMM